MKCYRKNGSDCRIPPLPHLELQPSMKCYRKNGSDEVGQRRGSVPNSALNEVLPKER